MIIKGRTCVSVPFILGGIAFCQFFFREVSILGGITMIVIAGAGGHGVSVFSALSQTGLYADYFYDDTPDAAVELCGIPIHGTVQFPDNPDDFVDIFIAVGNGSLRNEIRNRLLGRYQRLRFPSFVHHTALVSDSAALADGVMVMPFAYVGPNCSVGELSLLNTRSTLEHDCHMGYCSTLAPGVTTGGNVCIGNFADLSIGVVVSRSVCIGHHSVVGAGSYVHCDVPDGTLVYGSPAKVVRPV